MQEVMDPFDFKLSDKQYIHVWYSMQYRTPYIYKNKSKSTPCFVSLEIMYTYFVSVEIRVNVHLFCSSVHQILVCCVVFQDSYTAQFCFVFYQIFVYFACEAVIIRVREDVLR